MKLNIHFNCIHILKVLSVQLYLLNKPKLKYVRRIRKFHGFSIKMKIRWVYDTSMPINKKLFNLQSRAWYQFEGFYYHYMLMWST